jgi:UDP-GlcNAc:undecaprenyl-phosphate GlcNAc-1-phosphate transferase
MTVFLLTACIAFAITPAIIWWYKHNAWLDKPELQNHAKRTHTAVVPRGGGVVIFSAVLLAVLTFLEFDKHLLGIIAGAFALTVIGFFDDIWDIHPLWRLFGGVLAGLIVVGSGIGVAYVTNPFGPGVIHLNQPQLAFTLFGQPHTIWILADILALIFIVWNMNIVNWSKGVDGQLPGFVSIAALFIGFMSTKFIDDPAQFNTAHLSFIVAGAYAGYLYWNWYPQKSMPGYGAGSLAGYFLAVLSILSGAKFATTLMVLAIPTADAIFTIGRRILAGKSPLWGDRGHLHHKLLDVLGWGRRRIALFYWGTSLVLGTLSLYLNTWGKLITMGISASLVFGFLIWAKVHDTRHLKHAD